MGRSLRLNQEARWGLIFALPWIVAFLVFTAYPILLAVKMSYLDINLLQVEKARFVGFDNWVRAVQDPVFWKALFNVVYNQAIFISLSFVVAMVFAALLKEIRYGGTFFRTMYFLPVVTSVTVAMLIFKFIADPQGPIQQSLIEMGLLEKPVFWTFSKWLPMPILAIFNTWKWFGVQLLIFLGGMLSINPEILEAAAVDGAGAWTRFRRITLPLLRPQIIFVLTMNLINGLQMFTEVFLTFDLYGGPYGSGLTPVLYIYTKGFTEMEMGYAATLGLFLAAIIFVAQQLQSRILTRQTAGE
ncbi:MAG TPA: sugar ABC transporter permease [Symbiobacteriaceae bacterium]